MVYDIQQISGLKISLWERFLLLFKRKQYSKFKGVKGSASGRIVFKMLKGKMYILRIEE